jgi:hypothetical protein
MKGDELLQSLSVVRFTVLADCHETLAINSQ